MGGPRAGLSVSLCLSEFFIHMFFRSSVESQCVSVMVYASGVQTTYSDRKAVFPLSPEGRKVILLFGGEPVAF